MSELTALLSAPDDGARWLALALCPVVLFALPWLLRTPARRKVVVPLAALCAAALSAGYVVYYLRGAPRIIDATAYWLQARALAEGWLSWPLGCKIGVTRLL